MAFIVEYTQAYPSRLLYVSIITLLTPEGWESHAAKFAQDFILRLLQVACKKSSVKISKGGVFEGGCLVRASKFVRQRLWPKLGQNHRWTDKNDDSNWS